MNISIELDRESDQLYVLFRAAGALKGSVAKTVRLTENVVADLDADGKLIGLDVSRASEALGIEDLEQLSVAVAVGGGKRHKA
ncbi:MAG: DUF2283 domain-containing protein [Chloroflexi bacterium]|nr:DUF2283 domain-containing protein [Chloroflexota bacterium]